MLTMLTLVPWNIIGVTSSTTGQGGGDESPDCIEMMLMDLAIYAVWYCSVVPLLEVI